MREIIGFLTIVFIIVALVSCATQPDKCEPLKQQDIFRYYQCKGGG